jgi:hypothetical protein
MMLNHPSQTRRIKDRVRRKTRQASGAEPPKRRWEKPRPRKQICTSKNSAQSKGVHIYDSVKSPPDQQNPLTRNSMRGWAIRCRGRLQ